MNSQRHCVLADISLYEHLRRRLSERGLTPGLIPLWAILSGTSDFLRLSADEYIDADQKQFAKEKQGQSMVEIVGGAEGNHHFWLNSPFIFSFFVEFALYFFIFG